MFGKTEAELFHPVVLFGSFRRLSSASDISREAAAEVKPENHLKIAARTRWSWQMIAKY